MKLLSDICLFACLAIMAVLCGMGWLVEKVIELGCLVVQGWKEIRKLSVLLAMGTLSAQAGEWLHYDAARRVPWANAPLTYTRCDYDWWVQNTGQPSDLYKDGVYQESEPGNYDLNLPAVWAIQPNANGIKVGIVDKDTIHGQAAVALVRKVAPGAIVTLYPVSRYYPEVVAPAIESAVAAGCKVVVLTTGYAASTFQLEMACHFVGWQGVLVCAVPNNPQDLATVPDYPASYAMPHILPVNATDRNGAPYWSATGVKCVGAPGRNIIGTDYYSSGTSYATPITAGCVALLMARKQGYTPSWYVDRIRITATPAGLTRRINPVGMVQ